MKNVFRFLSVCLVVLLSVWLVLDGQPADARSHHRHGAEGAVTPSVTAAPGQETERLAHVALASLPKQAQETLKLILAGGPFPYEKDGTVFGNYEGKLPRQRRGYYTEYTVKTPRVRSRGARRIIAGGRGGQYSEFYYTDDHYQTFRRIDYP